jgi:hypothetical protein
MATSIGQTFAHVVEDLVAEAVSRNVPPEVAEEARRVTTQGVRAPTGPVTPQTRRRIEAYFSAVVRRRVVRRSSAPRAAARFVVASVVADLRSTGRTGADIWDELQRGWAQRIPGDVLEEYRLRLCG